MTTAPVDLFAVDLSPDFFFNFLTSKTLCCVSFDIKVLRSARVMDGADGGGGGGGANNEGFDSPLCMTVEDFEAGRVKAKLA